MDLVVITQGSLDYLREIQATLKSDGIESRCGALPGSG
jgi:hypothetical protein